MNHGLIFTANVRRCVISADTHRALWRLFNQLSASGS
nr:MAG TPA: hypothetical protein [Bacteriophage sp.]